MLKSIILKAKSSKGEFAIAPLLIITFLFVLAGLYAAWRYSVVYSITCGLSTSAIHKLDGSNSSLSGIHRAIDKGQNEAKQSAMNLKAITAESNGDYALDYFHYPWAGGIKIVSTALIRPMTWVNGAKIDVDNEDPDSAMTDDFGNRLMDDGSVWYNTSQYGLDIFNSTQSLSFADAAISMYQKMPIRAVTRGRLQLFKGLFTIKVSCDAYGFTNAVGAAAAATAFPTPTLVPIPTSTPVPGTSPTPTPTAKPTPTPTPPLTCDQERTKHPGLAEECGGRNAEYRNSFNPECGSCCWCVDHRIPANLKHSAERDGECNSNTKAPEGAVNCKVVYKEGNCAPFCLTPCWVCEQGGKKKKKKKKKNTPDYPSNEDSPDDGEDIYGLGEYPNDLDPEALERIRELERVQDQQQEDWRTEVEKPLDIEIQTLNEQLRKLKERDPETLTEAEKIALELEFIRIQQELDRVNQELSEIEQEFDERQRRYDESLERVVEEERRLQETDNQESTIKDEGVFSEQAQQDPLFPVVQETIDQCQAIEGGAFSCSGDYIIPPLFLQELNSDTNPPNFDESGNAVYTCHEGMEFVPGRGCE